jgi:NitT/TauT family transport system ATP-binding protein
MSTVPLRPDVANGTEAAAGQQRGPAMIEIESVSQRFAISGRKSHLALSDISLAVEGGAFVSIL